MMECGNSYEFIIDGAPGVGKTFLINNIIPKIQERYGKNINLLVNGAAFDEKRDELVLALAEEGDISFIQKRYDHNHCFKRESINDVMFFHHTSAEHDTQCNNWIKKQFPHCITVNFKERDGPSSAVIFNWTSYKDVVLSSKSHAPKDILSWNVISGKMEPFLQDWINTIKEGKIKKNFIYLQASPEFIYQRVKERNREYEAAWFTMELAASLAGAYNYFFNENSDNKEPLLHTIDELYPSDLTTYAVFDAESPHLGEKVLDYIMNFFAAAT